ncbi:hypothetical protein ACO0LO_17685 [Undibacterium sp. TJN25]|uniref:hypothetical protein n=1 Tax=Undibacterium sp. TJN25 TaxID=3413056 RepID=UPI003BF37157
MAVGRVTAVILPQTARNQPGANGPGTQFSVGETIQVTLGDAAASELLARSADGLPFRLTGLAGLEHLAGSLSPGDILQLRVLATSPQLELAVFSPEERGSSSAGASPESSNGTNAAAMQLDQAVLSRQVNWRAPDAATLATSWRVMVLSFFQQQNALREQARGLHVPGNLLMADPSASALRDNSRIPASIDAESWLFAAYTWNGQKLMLRVLGTDEDEASYRKGRRGKIALRVELLLPGVGQVSVQMELAAGGVMLDLAAEQMDTMQHLREALRGLASAIARSGLSIVRCRLLRSLPPISPLNSMRAEAGMEEMRPELFRAMAEVIGFLIQPGA